jgi:radical SAM superfamily enzyme YgiQ (UPF0313 family)
MNTGKAIIIGAEDEENLAIRYLGAELNKNGHEVRIVSCSGYHDIPLVLNELKKFNPEMVAISMAFQSLAVMFLELAQKIKEVNPDVHLTVGGHFPTFEYQNLLKQYTIDSVIRFEGEKPINILLESLINNKKLNNIPNLIYKADDHIQENPCQNLFPVLDDLTFPLREKKAQERLGEKFATLITSRGCFHSKCIYCCIGAFHQPKKGKKYALRSPENVAREMGILYHQKKVRLFQFHDDNLLLPTPEESLKRLESLKTSLKNEKIDISQIGLLIKTRPDALDWEVVSLLKELGVVGIFLGVENASYSGLRALGRGSNRDEINEALDLLKGNLSVTFNLLIFHPRATLQEINENIYFMKDHLDLAFDFGRAEIVAGSPLEKMVQRKNLLRGQWPHWDYRIVDDAVEKMFRINALTFYKDDSPYPALSHKLIALSYRSQLLNRFYPGRKSQKFQRETENLIRTSNEFTLKNLLEIYRMVAYGEDEIGLLYHQMEAFYGYLTSKALDLSGRMARFQLVEKKFKKRGVDNYLQNSKTMERIFRI